MSGSGKVVPVGSKDGIEVLDTGPPSPYQLNVTDLNDLSANKDDAKLKELGGVSGLAAAIGANITTGLDPAAEGDASIATHAATFGENKYKTQPPKSFFGLVWDNLQDPVVQLLCVAALISTVLGAAIPEERAHNGWIEGVAIWVAVLLVTCVGAGNDYNKDLQFRKLNAQKDAVMVKVVRGGQQELIVTFDIVCGDVVVLDMGDKVLADGILINSFGIVLDEASLTGESDPIKKTADEDPWIRSGTQVSEGSGLMLVTAVGSNSEWGKTLELVGEAGDENTPLQEKLEDVAAAIGKIGFGVAVACFVALIIKWCVENHGFPIKKVNDNGPVQFFLYAVTIIVVAVPEGLPLAVTISLAYSMSKMMKDNNFVRVLAACETMGGATAICSDKTGTLTENRMTVVEGWFSGKQMDRIPTSSELKEDLLNDLKLNMSINSKAFLIEHSDKPIEFVGNRTECALLMLLKSWGFNYHTAREEYATKLIKLHGFTSARKMSSCVIKTERSYRLYNKGAAEWVLKKCSSFVNEDGDVVPMDDEAREALMNVVVNMAQRGLRCIALTRCDHSLEHPESFFDEPETLDNDLTALAIVGIKDPVRKEVPEAVRICQKAGITVRMVTGDNIHTARHIAAECGILVPGSQSMEGPTFREMSAPELMPLLPNLRVLARSSPEDKLTLVRMLKQQGEVVAVTGDGTNDAPALKESDVGLAMGIAGTEVAKEAADIVILDDNFSSIVKSVLWGRSVFNNIRKFLQFQLTVNCVALVISFIGAIVGGHEPLNVLQLLWVNLIMDTMGALALATEQPTNDLLDEKPHGREEPLISKKMWKHICIQGLYQLFWMLLLLYGLPVLLPKYRITTEDDYYNANCASQAMSKLNIRAGNYPPTNYNDIVNVGANWMCVLITQCGWPLGGNGRSITGCYVLNTYFGTQNATVPGVSLPNVPSNQYQALCAPYYLVDSAGQPMYGYNASIVAGTVTPSCALNDAVGSVASDLASGYKQQVDDDWMAPLSVLFNAFIMLQVANEINARRINDEYTIFTGILDSPIFIAVIIITMGLQAIIINFMGLFFKVRPLNGAEWGATMAIGAGSWPVSLLTRFISRMIESKIARQQAAEASARASSGRSSSKNGSLKGLPRSGSGRVQLRAKIMTK